MYRLLMRDLALAARDPGLRLALLGSLAALIAVAVPLYIRILGAAAISSVAEAELLVSRLMTIQWVVACAVAPWAILRLGQPEQGDDLVYQIALSRRPPWRVALTRWASGTLFLSQLLIVGLPVVMVASHVSAARPEAILRAYLDLAIFLGLLALAVCHWGLAGRPGLATLGLAYLTALVLAAGRHTLLASSGRTNVTIGSLAAALGLGLWLVQRSAGKLLYLDDGPSR